MILPRYSSRYPRQGKFAILCEGDVAGYEADLLEKWFALQSPHLFVDVWTCGTKTAIFGMADAIGRAIPFSVIEDRDYRTIERAQKDCEAAKKDREDRGTHVRSWRAWGRHEIENYLIEPAVAVPVLSRWFKANETQIIERLESVLTQSVVDQAAQFALSILRASLPEPQKEVSGLPRAGVRPSWNASQRAIVSPAREVVQKKLSEVIQKSCELFCGKAQKIDPASILGSFVAQADAWSKVKIGDQTWRTDWAGKEILVTLCRWLAGEFGWPGENGQHEPLDWSLLKRPQSDEKDREIAVALQRDLVDEFLRYLQSGKDVVIRKEWDEIISQFASA